MRRRNFSSSCLGLSLKLTLFLCWQFVAGREHSGQSCLFRDLILKESRNFAITCYQWSPKKLLEFIISQRPSFVKNLRWLNVAEHHQFPGRIVCWIQCIFVSLKLLKKSGWDIECGATLSTLQSLHTNQHLGPRKCSKLKLSRKTIIKLQLARESICFPDNTLIIWSFEEILSKCPRNVILCL